MSTNHITIILKPTRACNANCIYCSAWGDDQAEVQNKIKTTMSKKTLQKVFERIEEWIKNSKQKRRIKIIWHGGEPTLMPVEFFYNAIKMQESIKKRYGMEIENNIQSNLLFLNNEKLTMLKQLLSFKGKIKTIGTSFEPLPDIRVLKNKDYLDEWEKSIACLKENKMPFGIVYVVHRKSIENIEYLTNIFKKRFPDIGIRFNPLYQEGKAKKSICQPLYITPLEWGKFLIDLYQIWEKMDKKPNWQPLKEYDTFHFNRDARMCCDHSGRCGDTHLGIDTDGTFYSCGRGIDRKYKPYGNVYEKSFSQVLQAPSRLEMKNRAVFLKNTNCRDCQWWRYCHGGCPMDAAINNKNNIFKKSNFCVSRKRFLEAIYKEPVH